MVVVFEQAVGFKAQKKQSHKSTRGGNIGNIDGRSSDNCYQKDTVQIGSLLGTSSIPVTQSYGANTLMGRWPTVAQSHGSVIGRSTTKEAKYAAALSNASAFPPT